MKHHSSTQRPIIHRSGFTLIELLMVIMIISILAALTLGAFRFANIKAARDKTKTMIKAIELGLDRYELDYGGYPAPGNFTALGGTAAGGTLSAETEGSALLYIVLTGDLDRNGEINGAETGTDFDIGVGKQDQLGIFEDLGTGEYLIVDPFGNPIQYSVMVSDGQTPPMLIPSLMGHTQRNSTYDLWSYGDAETLTATPGDPEEAKWLTNW